MHEPLYLLLSAVVVAVSWRQAARGRLIVAFLVTLVGLLGAGLIPPLVLFMMMRLWAWGAFVVAPVALLGQAWYGRNVAPAVLAVLLVGVGLEAFVREPHALRVVRYEVPSPHVDAPLRVAVISDIQTDAVGDYERRAVAMAMAERPDLVLLPGDFVQRYDDRRDAELAAMAEVLGALDAPLGVHAVGGNSEEDLTDWISVFSAAGIRVHAEATTLPLATGLHLTALPLSESFDPRYPVRPAPGLHIVMGHAPDFAMSPDRAELSVAGHTHGGQVRFPGIGPLVTFSRVPRAWAEGHTVVEPGKHLIVSRGVGMERGYAPRMRFLCPPEVVVIDVVPAAR